METDGTHSFFRIGPKGVMDHVNGPATLKYQRFAAGGALVETLAGSGKLVVARRDNDANVIRDIAAQLRDKLGPSVVILGAADNGSPKLVAAATKSLAIDAREILKPAAPHIQGGAGGKPDLAMAGGRNADGLDEALAVAAKEAESALTR